MSHVRNLFHKTQGSYSPAPVPVPVTAVPEHPGKPPAIIKEFAPRTASSPEVPKPSVTILEFPVETVHLRPEHRLIFYTDPHSQAADRFRYLRMRLRELSNAGKLKKLLITSALAS